MNWIKNTAAIGIKMFRFNWECQRRINKNAFTSLQFAHMKYPAKLGNHSQLNLLILSTCKTAFHYFALSYKHSSFLTISKWLPPFSHLHLIWMIWLYTVGWVADKMFVHSLFSRSWFPHRCDSHRRVGIGKSCLKYSTHFCNYHLSDYTVSFSLTW